jgi:hypothetical protein
MAAHGARSFCAINIPQPLTSQLKQLFPHPPTPLPLKDRCLKKGLVMRSVDLAARMVGVTDKNFGAFSW